MWVQVPSLGDFLPHCRIPTCFWILPFYFHTCRGRYRWWVRRVGAGLGWPSHLAGLPTPLFCASSNMVQELGRGGRVAEVLGGTQHYVSSAEGWRSGSFRLEWGWILKAAGNFSAWSLAWGQDREQLWRGLPQALCCLPGGMKQDKVKLQQNLEESQDIRTLQELQSREGSPCGKVFGQKSNCCFETLQLSVSNVCKLCPLLQK